MIAVISYEPTFTISILKSQLQMLIKGSKLHYDYVCKVASCKTDGHVPNGFLTIWEFGVTRESKNAMATNLTNRNLQTCMKILEMPIPGYRTEERNKLSLEFLHVLRQNDATMPPSTNVRFEE